MSSGEEIVRTSVTDPLLINEVVAGGFGGRVGMTFCPGKRDRSWRGPSWRRDLALDLDVIVAWEAQIVVTLLEDHEFALLGVPDLAAAIRSRGIEWHHLPIVDVQPPDGRFETAWHELGPRLGDVLRRGGRVLVHCRGGIGRAGTVAARLLVEQGVLPHDAIQAVRTARPEAIETQAQERYVLDLEIRLG